MADNDKKPMSRLMKLAYKFNCFYLSGKQDRQVALALLRIIPIGASAGRVIDRNARLPFARTGENIDFVCCVYLSSASAEPSDGKICGNVREQRATIVLFALSTTVGAFPRNNSFKIIHRFFFFCDDECAKHKQHLFF